MPTFPAFAQRLNQINKPMNQGVAETPMEFGMPMGGPSQNPMRRRRPVGDQGEIPLIQSQNPSNELPESSGTGAAPAAMAGRSMVDKIKEKVAGEVRYEDIAPKMEEIPGTPAFNPKPVKGIGGRIKAAFQAAGAATQMHPGSPYAGLVGLAAGAIKPGIAQGLDYQHRVLPEAHRQQAEVMARNDARQKSFGVELGNRERVAKINQMNEPDWAAVPGAELPSLYEKHSGETRQVMGPDGKPVRSASVVNAEDHNETLKELALVRKIAQQEHDTRTASENAAKSEREKAVKEALAKQAQEFKAREAEKERTFKAGEGKANRGVRTSEGAANRKSREEIANKRGSGRGRGSSEPVKPIERFPNIFQTPMNQNNFALPPRGNKLPTN